MPKGLKINNDKSTVAPPPNSGEAELKKTANEASKRLTDYKARAWELGTKFKQLIENSILPENKSEISKDLESEILRDLGQLANDINTDRDQSEGSGSVALSQLIMKMLLLQRDKINLQKFEIEQLRKQLNQINEKLENNVVKG